MQFFVTDNFETNNDPNFHVNDDSYFHINDNPKIDFDNNADFYINNDPDFYINVGVEVKREMQTCQGSKLCEFAASELHNQTHQCVDINSDLMMRISQEISSSNMDTNTFELYLAACETPCNFRKKQTIESQKINSKDNEFKESGITMMEKLKYKKHMVMIAEVKKKLRELRISNAIKEHEYGFKE
ncbi:hypothetical protein C2G38_2149530 [Gigaspora rosea]|uniref:Uncharacterized protein n=1 Tax=Gigaspora rosea TaxID=44941 RepID=A0A397U305_9GLOM|nr:hypothetical protein C2G38_2149530 [Gigaspora rosea]